MKMLVNLGTCGLVKRRMEKMRSKARHDEAQALNNARLQERMQRDVHWQGVVADKDAAIADKDALIAELRAQLSKSK